MALRRSRRSRVKRPSIILAVALLLSSAPAAAQPYGAAPVYRNNAMRIAGIVLTSIGSALLASGVALIAVDQAAPNPHCSDFCGFGTTLGGLFLVPISVGFATAGVPLWVVGARPAHTADLMPPAIPRPSFARALGAPAAFDHAAGALGPPAPWTGTLTWSF